MPAPDSAPDRPLDGAGSARQSRRFLYLYALAAAGGAVAYVPFLTVLLPIKVAALTGTEDVALLAYLAFAGAVAASLANIAFGWLSDRTGSRRGWIIAGLVASGGLMIAMRSADTAAMLLSLIIAWQLALNMMLGPLAAWAGDCIPDAQKGTLGGLLAFAPALGAATGALVTLPGLATADERLVIVAVMVATMVLPAVLFGRPRAMPHLMTPTVGENEDRNNTAKSQPSLRGRNAIARMWMARLLVQIAEAALFAYILFWFRSIDPGFGDNRTAILFGAVLLAAVPVALLSGRWSDRSARPMMPLALSAAVGCAGLVVMAIASSLAVAVIGYVIFGLASSVFLALHSGQTLRVLPKPRNRGRDLGLFNLTNTVPSLIMPWLTLALVPIFGFGALFALLAMLSAVAALLLFALTRRN